MPKIFVDVLQTGCLYASGGIFAANWDKASQRFESGNAACTNANLSYKVPLIVLSVLPFWLRLPLSGGGGGRARVVGAVAVGTVHIFFW